METILQYIWLGIEGTFIGADGMVTLMPCLMAMAGLLLGIIVGAVPGMSGPFAMALAYPALVSYFGVSDNALLPITGFLIGLMKGGTVGGAVPAILFRTPGTPDALMTTRDGYPLARKGQAAKAISVAHRASAMGDTFSDIALFVLAPFFAILIESYLNVGDKAALIVLSLSFMAVAAGHSPIPSLILGLVGMLLSMVGTSASSAGPRLTLGIPQLGSGIPLTSAILGILVVGEVLNTLEQTFRERRHKADKGPERVKLGDPHLSRAEYRRILPHIGVSAVIGTVIGALPGIGSTLAATLGYEVAQRRSRHPEEFGKGSIEGLAATEAANSSVSGSNLIPVLSLGIPGNFAAVFLLLAFQTVGEFTFGPSLFNFTPIREVEGYGIIMNASLVIVFSLFTLMMVANATNWLVGARMMRGLGFLALVPKTLILPVILLVSLTSAYAQDGGFIAVFIMLFFGFLAYFLNLLRISLLPFVIGFILAPNLETLIRGAYTASGRDPFFLLTSPFSVIFLLLSLVLIYYGVRHGSVEDELTDKLDEIEDDTEERKEETSR